jgi:phage major head subunit gpT-like protein
MAFNSGFAGAPSYYRTASMVVPSTSRDETYAWLGQFPKVREWIGDRLIKNLSAHGYTIKNLSFEQTIEVDRDDIEDDHYGVFTPMMSEMGRAAAEKPDELIFSLLKNGFASNCYDSQYFFDTDHPVGDGNGGTTNVANTDGGSGTPWFLLDTSRALKPLIFQERRPLGVLVSKDRPEDDNVFNRKQFVYGSDGRCNAGYGLWQLAWGSKQTLNAANYAIARAAMMNLVGDEGRPLGIVPDTLIVPPSLEGAARGIVVNQLVNGGESNPWVGTAKPLVTTWVA